MQDTNITGNRPKARKQKSFELDDLKPNRKELLQAKNFMRVLSNKHNTDKGKLCVLKALKDLIVAELPLAEKPSNKESV